MHVCMEVRDYTGCLPLPISTLSFETASLIELRTWQRLDWLASKLWGSSCLHPLSIIITDMTTFGFHVCATEPNSDIHASLVGTLQTEPSPKPQTFVF